jgi:hypothetical protein
MFLQTCFSCVWSVHIRDVITCHLWSSYSYYSQRHLQEPQNHIFIYHEGMSAFMLVIPYSENWLGEYILHLKNIYWKLHLNLLAWDWACWNLQFDRSSWLNTFAPKALGQKNTHVLHQIIRRFSWPASTQWILQYLPVASALLNGGLTKTSVTIQQG